MAIEDAIVFTDCIEASGDDYAAAFNAFESKRLKRTARVQLESRHLWFQLYHTGGVETDVRNEAWRARTDEDVWRCLDWLYKDAPG